MNSLVSFLVLLELLYRVFPFHGQYNVGPCPSQQRTSSAAILSALCDVFLEEQVAAIIYINNKEQYGRNTASTQYFLQLARYLGIPVIAWNADNSGLDQEQVRLE